MHLRNLKFVGFWRPLNAVRPLPCLPFSQKKKRTERKTKNPLHNWYGKNLTFMVKIKKKKKHTEHRMHLRPSKIWKVIGSISIVATPIHVFLPVFCQNPALWLVNWQEVCISSMLQMTVDLLTCKNGFLIKKENYWY